MDEISLEYRVKRNPKSSDMLIRFGAIAVTVLVSLAAFLINFILFLPAIACIVACIIFLPRLNVEYEYLFVAGELSIDCIFDKKSRKNVVSYPMNDVELISLEGNDRLMMYRNMKCRTFDLTSGDPSASRYVIVCRLNGETHYCTIEPGNDIIEAIRNRYPSKFAR